MKKQLLLLAALCLAAVQARGQEVVAQGECGAEGDNVTWTLTADSTLTISGTGAMAGYVNQNYQPWYEYQGSIKVCTIADGVTSIGRFAFMRCPALASVAIGEDVTGIEYGAFASCPALTSVTFPDGMASIGDFAFENCTALASVTLPGMADIGVYAFSYCESLTSVTLPDGMASIGNAAFKGCTSLASLTCRAAVPPAIEYSTFDGVDNSIPVYVPAGSIETYRTAEYWGAFTNYQPLPDVTTGIAAPSLGERIMVVNGEVHLNLPGTFEAQVYDLQGRHVLNTTENRFTLPQGVYIIKVGDEAVKLSL